ncbi:MAG: DUF6559 family protein [Cyanobacteria bacterium J06621_11]
MVALLNLLILVGILSGTAIPLALVPSYIANRHHKHKALRDYVRRLGRVLRVRHGVQESYSPEQVICMMRKWGYNSAYDGYGLALYCNQSDFEAYYATMSAPFDYAITRTELNRYLAFADIDFSAADIVELGDRLNAQGRAKKKADDNTYDSSDLDNVSSFIRSNKGRDYGDNFVDRSKGSGSAIGDAGGYIGFD